jgi:hypothetical protein
LTCEVFDQYTTQTISRFGRDSTTENLENCIKAQGHKIVEYQEEIIEQNELKLSDTVILPSTEYCQKFWGTSQTNIVIPSRHINGTKNHLLAL